MQRFRDRFVIFLELIYYTLCELCCCYFCPDPILSSSSFHNIQNDWLFTHCDSVGISAMRLVHRHIVFATSWRSSWASQSNPNSGCGAYRRRPNALIFRRFATVFRQPKHMSTRTASSVLAGWLTNSPTNLGVYFRRLSCFGNESQSQSAVEHVSNQKFKITRMDKIDSNVDGNWIIPTGILRLFSWPDQINRI